MAIKMLMILVLDKMIVMMSGTTGLKMTKVAMMTVMENSKIALFTTFVRSYSSKKNSLFFKRKILTSSISCLDSFQMSSNNNCRTCSRKQSNSTKSNYKKIRCKSSKRKSIARKWSLKISSRSILSEEYEFKLTFTN